MNAPGRSSLPAGFHTHEVTNQPPDLSPYDAWATDTPLREAIIREGGGGWAEADIACYGQRIDEAEFHPAYHRIMALGIERGVPSYAWRNEDRPGAHVARMGISYLHNQADQGTSCPLATTYACVPALRHQPESAQAWLPRIIATGYDGRSMPAWDKPGNTIGMGMTEKQGGSDVHANTTRATPVAADGSGQLYRIVGHKWFYSAPMCDAHLVLAYSPGGISCFLMSRWTPDGRRNEVRIQRLKDKLGDWSNVSAAVDFQNALAWMVGEEGRGVATIHPGDGGADAAGQRPAACVQSSGCGYVLRTAVRSGAWSGFWYLACARADGRADRARVPGRLKRP